MRKLMNVMRGCLVAIITVAVLSACGGGGSVGSSVSIDITTPATDTNVDVTAPIIATITDNDHVGITVPSSWSDVFKLRQVGSETNLCTDDVITYDSASSPQTVTCSPGTLFGMTQYSISISGLTDAAGNRIDPAAMTFTTGQI